MPIHNITCEITDDRGYEFLEVDEWLAQQCSILPCFKALQWGVYDTTIIEENINGHDVVIQLWKGRCDKPLGSEFPGGIGGEVGIYRRIPGREVPSNVPSFLRPLLAPLAHGADIWWPYPELGVTMEFELINPKTGKTFFRTGSSQGKFGYWLTRWMRFTSYDRYKKTVENPVWAVNYWMVATVNGKKYVWGPPELAMNYAVNASGVTTDGRLLHTTRDPRGEWAHYGNVEGPAGDAGTIVDVDLVRNGNTLYLCAVNSAGNIAYTTRAPTSSWKPFVDVESKTGETGAFTRVSLASLGQKLFIAGVTNNGRLWHTIHDQSIVATMARIEWVPFSDVETKAGECGTFVDVDCATIGNVVHLCGVTADGRLWHTIRRDDGTWQSFDDTRESVGNRGPLVEVACASVAGVLHVCAISSDGRLWHAVRRTDRTWHPFTDMEGLAGNRGTFVRVSAGDSDGWLHVCGVTSDGKVWHAIRRSDGSWQPFVDVNALAGNVGSFKTISIDGI